MTRAALIAPRPPAMYHSDRREEAGWCKEKGIEVIDGSEACT